MQNTINFNKLLYEELHKNNNTNKKCCLISNIPLKTSHIVLQCKHAFNYKPLLKEIKNQKLKNSYLETQRLKKSQIKCPYCRSIQNGILPYRNNDEKIKYVNWPENLAYKPFKCGYIFLSGKKKNETCSKPCANKYCLQHKRIMDKRNEKKMKQQEENKKKQEEKANNTILKHLINNTENEIISHINNLSSDSYFMKCKQEFSNNNLVFPKLHVTKNFSYFRCQCQHQIIKGNTTRQCKKYMICSEKLNHKNKKQTITPKIHKKYLCNMHKYDNDPQSNNFIVFPDNILIDIDNIPKCYIENSATFNKYLSKYYNKYFHSQVYDYKKFQQFKKTSILIEDHYVDFEISMTNL